MPYLVFPVHLSLFCTSFDVDPIYLPFVLLGSLPRALCFKEFTLI